MKKKILVADDEPHILNLIKLILGNDFTIITAENGEEALNKVKTENPDLVLLDIMMPKLNGYEVCKKLKSHPSTKNIVIAMLSAKKEDQDILNGIELGADAYITKPFEPTELERRVNELLAMLN